MNRIALSLIVTAGLATGSATAQTEAPPPSLALGQSVAGELGASDVQRRSGKYEDVYAFQGRRGQRVQLDLGSEAFDPYLVVTGPDGFVLANDDAEGGEGLASRLVFELPADGAYRVAATSFRAGETGAYRLQASLPAADAIVSAPVVAMPIAVGAAVDGRLAEGDGREGSGAFADRYRFHARRGQRVAIALGSDKMDTVLRLARPDGSEDVSDDTRVDGRTSTDSRIDTVLAEDGDYVVTVTSYRPGQAGPYRLSLAPSPGHPRQLGVPGGARVIALLVGVSDYGGRTNDLPNTDEDARTLYESLRGAGLLHPASQLLTNGEATTKAVAEAFARAAAAAGPNDTFLFFFSGHGDQVDAPASAAELDGRAETIELYDAAMTDAELAPLFARVHGRLSLAAIDACYAGGFRNLVDRPNVMGLFSSEEDLTSLVASRFKAGGFLAYFLRTGLAGDADDDGDRIVTAGELSTYVRRRFRREGDIPATTREDDRGYQNLLVERGGLQVEDVIVRLAGGPQVAAAPRPAAVRMQPEATKRR
ncbi:MAG TPA: pre-peptidase C-terminal domain-containing protein [Allosphingosinicella sp.]|nr:pre-peptidase C-terminal domain-containing protein [Allosphingosinicella sp.]